MTTPQHVAQEIGLDAQGTERLLRDVYEEDDIRYNSVEDIRPITKREIIDDIWAWRDDDGEFSDPDISVFLQYDDGTVYINGWGSSSGSHYRDKPKKSGVIGASINTGDYEEVWGYEVNERTGKRSLIQTWSEDGESGLTNTYSGYKQVSKYRVRKRTTTYWDDNYKKYGYYGPKGGYRTKIDVVRKSKTVPIDHY